MNMSSIQVMGIKGAARAARKIYESLPALLLAFSFLLPGLPALSQNSATDIAQKKEVKKQDAKPDAKAKDKPGDKGGKDKGSDKADKAKDDKTEKAESKPKPEPVIENVVAVPLAEELVSKPQEYLGKNVKFNANFFAFSNLALDYKPALRSSKTHLSFLVLRNKSHVPLSELKLAMEVPKEKDPETAMLATLKDGDQIEITAKVFATALDEPWLDVLKLKKLSVDKDEKKATAKASNETKDDGKADKGSKSESESPSQNKTR